MREAIAFVIKKRLDGQSCLALPKDLDFSGTIFAADHLMRLDRCEENLGKETLRALRMLRLDRLLVEVDPKPAAQQQHEQKLFDAEALVAAADALCARVKGGLERRAAVVAAAHRAREAELERAMESWTNQHEDLVALRGQLQSVPPEIVQSYDAPPSWMDSVLSFSAARTSRGCGISTRR